MAKVESLTGDPELDELIGDGDPADIFRELKLEEARRLQDRKFGFYEPNGKCEEYIQAVGSGDNFITFFSAANGVGKTAASANILAHIIFPHLSDNPYFKEVGLKLFENWEYPKRGRIVTDPNNIPNVVNALREWFPKGHYTAKKGTKSYESKWKAGEWEFEIMSYEQDPKEFEGPTLGFVWFDEPPPHSIYTACISRLRMGGHMFISATPLAGSGWMYDSFVTGNTEAKGLEDGEVIKRSIAHVQADVEAACIQHGERGHLEHEHIQQMIAEYDEDERQARVFGKFQHLVGLVFKTFDRAVHVIKPFEVDRRRFTVYHALDPHPRNEDAGMWLAVDEKGTKYIVDELYISPRNGTEELAQLIKNKNDKYRVVRKIIDPSAFIEDQHTQQSLVSRLEGFGLSYLMASKARDASNRRIGDALSFSKLPNGEFAKAPEFYIFESCVRTIWEMEHYRWDEWTGRTSDKRNRKEKPVDKDDHMIEDLGRLLFQEPAFIPMENRVYDSSPGKGSADPYDNPMM